MSATEILPHTDGRARSLMLQGTASSVGKSLMTAAFCRIFSQDGIRVAPFKAQNMSNNSWVTHDGREIARSQVVQAQAAGIEPDARMNPILLKPLNEKESQVVVCGKAEGSWHFGHYAERYHHYSRVVHDAYDSLSKEYDLIVLEGAGCSAEINLKKGDLVNMNMARHARSHVYLVGDIDRGGVFAAFIGMMTTFKDWEKELVKGFIVNRFRGDVALLGDVYQQMKDYTGKEICGVVPFLPDLFIPEEDGVQFAATSFDDQTALGERLDVAVIALRHVSNFTDLDPLRLEESVRVRLVHTPQELGEPDVVIIPGSRNVFSDFEFLSEVGLDAAICELSKSSHCEILGICGGFQIMGETIADPGAIESTGETIKALGLIPIDTELLPDKKLSRETAHHCTTGLPLSGYRIHHGLSSSKNGTPAVISKDGETIGYYATDTFHWGTYLHGIFDSPDFRHAYINKIRARKGQCAIQAVFEISLEGEFDRLAEAVRESVDMKSIYKTLGF